MNLLYILLLVLWSAFNSSDAWYYREPPHTTAQTSQTGASSNPCWYWYNTPCYWATTQPNDADQTHYQTQTQAPSRWRPYYQMPTQAPSWRRPYYQMPTQAPSWWRPYYQKPTQAPSWRRTYYWMTTQAPSRRRPYYQKPTQAPSWRRPYYWMTTQAPSRRRPYYWMTTQAPSWRRPYYWMTTQTPFRRRPYYQKPTQAPSWRRPYYQMPTQAPSWRRPYYWMTTSYWRIQDAPVPSITVFRQNQDREHVIVMCSFGRRFTESSFQLSVEGEHSYTLKNPLCYSNEKCVFDVKVSTPVSFTCVHEINSAVNCQSETYAYSPSGKTYDFPAVLDQHENGVSSFYFGFFSFIVVCLFTMTAAVIMATLKTISNAKGSKITGAANDYTDV